MFRAHLRTTGIPVSFARSSAQLVRAVVGAFAFSPARICGHTFASRWKYRPTIPDLYLRRPGIRHLRMAELHLVWGQSDLSRAAHGTATLGMGNRLGILGRFLLLQLRPIEAKMNFNRLRQDLQQLRGEDGVVPASEAVDMLTKVLAPLL